MVKEIGLAKIVGALSAEGWGQVHNFLPDDEEKLAKRGSLFLALSLKRTPQQSDEEVASAGKEIISRIHEEYYGKLESSPYEQIAASIDKVSKENGSEGRLGVVAAVIINEILYVAVLGEGKLVIRRDGVISTIVVGKNDGSIVSASGLIKDNDLFILGSPGFFATIPLVDLHLAMNSDTAERAAEIVTPIVHKNNGHVVVAAVIVKVGEKKEEDERPEDSLPISHESNESLQSFVDRLTSRVEKIKAERNGKEKRMLFLVAGVLIGLLLLGVGVGARERGSAAKAKKADLVASQIEAKKAEIESLVRTDPNAAKAIFAQINKLIEEAKIGNYYDGKIAQLKPGLDELSPLVFREREVTPESYFDLGLLKSDAKVTDAAYSEEKIVILDSKQQALYRLSVEDKKSAIIAGGEVLLLGEKITSGWPYIYVVTPDNLYRTEEAKKQLVSVVKSGIEKVSGMGVFSGNVYVLGDGGILVFPATENGLSEKRNWLKDATRDLSGATSLAIDGSIWVGKDNGTILKFTRGLADEFAPTGLDKPLGRVDWVFVAQDEDKVFVLEKRENRIVVFRKTGEYLLSYHWNNMETINQFFVSQKTGKLFLLGESKIYTVGLE